MKEFWKKLTYPGILDGYEISSNGRIRAINRPIKADPITANYHSSNGYEYIQLIPNDVENHRILRYFPIDDLVAYEFIPIPDNLKNCKIKVDHINGNTRDYDLHNLRWIEDIEEWKPVPGYENLYEVSSHGRIRSLRKNIYNKLGRSRLYTTAAFSVGGRLKHMLMHRLLMITFRPIKNYDEMEVNHIDENHSNNDLKNLEWISKVDNDNFGSRKIRISLNYRGGRKRRRVKCIETGEVYNSMADASRATNIPRQTIGYICKNKITSDYYELHWEFIND